MRRGEGQPALRGGGGDVQVRQAGRGAREEARARLSRRQRREERGDAAVRCASPRERTRCSMAVCMGMSLLPF